MLAESVVDTLMDRLAHMVFGLYRRSEAAIGEHGMKPRVKVDVPFPCPRISPRIFANHGGVSLFAVELFNFVTLSRFIAIIHVITVVITKSQRKPIRTAKSNKFLMFDLLRRLTGGSGNDRRKSTVVRLFRATRRDGVRHCNSGQSGIASIHYNKPSELKPPGPQDRKPEQGGSAMPSLRYGDYYISVFHTPDKSGNSSCIAFVEIRHQRDRGLEGCFSPRS